MVIFNGPQACRSLAQIWYSRRVWRSGLQFYHELHCGTVKSKMPQMATVSSMHHCESGYDQPKKLRAINTNRPPSKLKRDTHVLIGNTKMKIMVTCVRTTFFSSYERYRGYFVIYLETHGSWATQFKHSRQGRSTIEHHRRFGLSHVGRAEAPKLHRWIRSVSYCAAPSSTAFCASGKISQKSFLLR